MAANLIATILIIAIHYRAPIADIAGFNYLFQEFFFYNGITRIAVPFFALISGYFIAQELSKETKYISILRKKLKTLFIPYLAASLLIFISVTCLRWLFKHETYQPVTIRLFIEYVIFHPLSGQFWYLRDLIILIILSPLIISNKRIHYFPLLIILGFSWLIDYQPFSIVFGWYLLNIETFFFFSLGGIIFYKKNLLESIRDMSMRTKVIIFCFWLILIAIRIYIDPTLDVWYVNKYSLSSLILYKLAILLGVCTLIQFSVYLSSNKHVIYISGLTFFAYLFHLQPLSFMFIVTARIVPSEYLFYINFPIALLMIFVIGHLVAKFLPKTYALLTGGRSPNKALNRIQ